MRTEKTPEAQFRVSMLVGEKRLGATLRLLGGTSGLSVDLVEDHATEKNLPRGAFREALRANLKDGPVARATLLARMVEMGFASTTFHSTITQLKAKGDIKLINRGGESMVALTRKAH